MMVVPFQAAAAAANQQNDPTSPLRHNGNYQPQPSNSTGQQLSPDLTEAFRLQEHRLEQALRLHGDPRSLGFSLTGGQQQHGGTQP